MFHYKNIIKGNYLQYARSYSFLIIIASTLILASGLIPAPDASYATVKFGSFSGKYNTEWIGIVTAILSSIFLSLGGFFLINGSIKKDIDSRIGHIIATTRISNTGYIITKLASNVLILFSLLIIVFTVSIIMFFIYGQEYSFDILNFIIPYALIAIPSLFFVASFSLVLEIIFPKRTLLQYSLFFAVFLLTLLSTIQSDLPTNTDIFGIHYPIEQIASQITKAHPTEDTSLLIGFVAEKVQSVNKIELKGISYSRPYLLSRLFWVIISLLLTTLVSRFFHRFSIKQTQNLNTEKTQFPSQKNQIKGFQLDDIKQKLEFSSNLWPLIKAELFLISRRHSKWFWILTLSAMAALIFAPLSIAHQYILPIVWFLQIGNLSDLVSKDYALRTHYFTASSYRPVQRLFVSRIVAGWTLTVCIALPLLIKSILLLEIGLVLNISLGALFIVLLSALFGILSKTKKLFEIVFFFITYCNINLVPYTDYFGGIHNTVMYTASMLMINILLFAFSAFASMSKDS